MWPALHIACRHLMRTCGFIFGLAVHKIEEIRVLHANRSPSCTVQVDTASAARSLLAWHPDGSLLAVPGCDNDVTVYERLSWEPTFSLAGQHSAPINAVCFSPDGACCNCSNAI